MERKLVRVLGRKEIAGRPLIYATTKLFLELFDLKDLTDLPTPREISDLENTVGEEQNTENISNDDKDTKNEVANPIQENDSPNST